MIFAVSFAVHKHKGQTQASVWLKYSSRLHRWFLMLFVLMSIIACFQNMWDLTPPTELLQELPAEYSTESALADLVVSFLILVFHFLIFDRAILWEDFLYIFSPSGQLITGFVVKWHEGKKVNQVSSFYFLTNIIISDSLPLWITFTW